MSLPLGEYVKTQQYLQEALLKINKANDNLKAQYHEKRAQVLAYLGNAYGELGEYEKAKNLLEQSLVIYQRDFPPNHNETAWAIAYLGDIYRIMGNFEKGQSLLEPSLTRYRQHFSEGHSEIVWVLERLRYAHDKISDYKKDEVTPKPLRE